MNIISILWNGTLLNYLWLQRGATEKGITIYNLIQVNLQQKAFVLMSKTVF
jgi:hypothetical protein